MALKSTSTSPSGSFGSAHAAVDRVLSAVPMLQQREDGADWLRRLRQAALIDESGIALDGALKTVATL